MSKKMKLTLVGVRHRVTPTTMREMQELTPLKIELRREPSNFHDENAVAVYCMEKPWNAMHIGFVARQVAAELAPRMDAGKFEVVSAYLTSLDADAGIGEMDINFNRPGKKPANKRKN